MWGVGGQSTCSPAIYSFFGRSTEVSGKPSRISLRRVTSVLDSSTPVTLWKIPCSLPSLPEGPPSLFFSLVLPRGLTDGLESPARTVPRKLFDEMVETQSPRRDLVSHLVSTFFGRALSFSLPTFLFLSFHGPSTSSKTELVDHTRFLGEGLSIHTHPTHPDHIEKRGGGSVLCQCRL